MEDREVNALRDAIMRSKEIGDVAFVFDSEDTGSNSYGAVCDKVLFPEIPRDVVSWVRQGDMIGGPSQTRRDLLTEHMEITRPLKAGDPSRFYVTTMTGLKEDTVDRIVYSLRRHPYFLGSVDLVKSKPVSKHFSTTLISVALLHGENCYQPGEAVEDGNVEPFDGKFSSFGYVVKSIEHDIWQFSVTPDYPDR